MFALPPTPLLMSQMLTERDLARHWRLSPRTLQRWRATGLGPPWYRIGDRILYRVDEVESFEASRRISGATP